MKQHTPVEGFSDAYYILPEVEFVPFSGDKIIAAHDLYRELAMITGYPLIRVAGDHHWLDSEWSVPADTIAVPQDTDLEDSSVLLTKRQTAREMVDSGLVQAP